MRLETLDLSDYGEEAELTSLYKRISKTHLRMLSSQVPESFLEKFKDEETALKELLDVVYGTMDFNDDHV